MLQNTWFILYLKTYNIDAMVADSAGTATAYLSK